MLRQERASVKYSEYLRPAWLTAGSVALGRPSDKEFGTEQMSPKVHSTLRGESQAL